MKAENIYACEKHLDKAFDHFLDDNEIFPYLSKILETNCSYCDKQAEYVLKGTEEEGGSQSL